MRKLLSVLQFCIIAMLTCFSLPSLAVSVNGLDLDVTVSGQGDTLVLFESGFGRGPEVWDSLAAQLPKHIVAVRYARAGIGKLPALAGQYFGILFQYCIGKILPALAGRYFGISFRYYIGKALAGRYFGIVIVIRISLYADRRRLNKRIFSVVAGSCCRISVHIAAVSEC